MQARRRCLAAALGAVPADERIVCVEDAAELAPRHPHLVKLVARCANVEGVGEVTVRDLVKQALRMRPDRIVVGEVRGAEVVDLLAALNTGHDGGAGTVHANNPAEVPARLEALGGLGGLDRAALHSQLAAAVQVVLHVSRDRAGQRRLSEIAVLRAGEDGRVARHDGVARRHRIRLRSRAFDGAHPRQGAVMSAAALILALALLIAPTSSRRRLETLRLVAPARRRLPVARSRRVPQLVLAFVVPVTVVAAAAIVGATVVVRRRRQRRLSRCRSESAALQAALDVLVGELRVGAHPVTAFEVATTEADGAVAASLRAVAARARLGADVAAGLRSVAQRSPVPAHWERLAVYWQLAQTHGLAIATLMQTAQRDIVERERFSARVAAGMAGARATAAVLAVLPAARCRFRPAHRGRSRAASCFPAAQAAGCWSSVSRWPASACCGRTGSPGRC